MTQYEVLRFLKEHENEAFTSQEIAKSLDMSKGRVTENLKHLKDFYPVFWFNRGSQRIFLYVFSRKVNRWKPRGKQIWNNTTMSRIR